MIEEIYKRVGNYIMNGDVSGAIAFMKEIPELKDVVQSYISIFEKEQYICYDMPEKLNQILLCYQQYFRDVFYLHVDHAKAEDVLFEKLKKELDLPNGDLSEVEKEMRHCFHQSGYQILCGKTNGYYGPYVWKETVPMTFYVELPETTSIYRINMLRGFIFRSWMDYLTFGEKGTGGWTSPDGTINCVEKAYDVNSEKFRVSLLKHEAQHSEDLRRWPDIRPQDLEYRAKLVELIYTQETNLLEKFCREANPERADDSHAVASARIRTEMSDLISAENGKIQSCAKILFAASSQEMEQYYR